MSYGEAIKRPFTDFKKLLIGILMSIFPIINFFAFGYILECAKTSNRKTFKMPEWEGWGEKFISGFFMLLIGLIYLIPFIIVGMVLLGNVFIQIMALESIEQILASSVGAIVISGIVLLITAYVTPSAVLNYYFNKKLSKAFQLKEVFKKAFNAEYFKAWIIGLIVYVVLAMLFSGIGRLSPALIVQQVSNAIISFIGGTIFYTMVGEVYQR